MFAERLDALMNIAEVSNSQLGREINMNPSHIGRLRSGTRPLPKRHEFLPPLCSYLAAHIQKDYQRTALQRLIGISSTAATSPEGMALHLEHWLSARETDTGAVTGRLISGFSQLAAHPRALPADRTAAEAAPQTYAAYLYGNDGKRKAVEQFFLMILQEETPQTLLLFSDENMAWLYEDPGFAARWADLFTQVLRKGNRVRIIHTVSRDMNEMIEAVTKWVPIYMTGAVEPYCYPRLRDGLFQRTLFLAPNTAAILSSSVQQATDGMLNLFLTDRAAIDALVKEYERYFALCRPLMRVYTQRDLQAFGKACDALMRAEANACLLCAMPPLFAMPEALVRQLAEQHGDETLLRLWKRDLARFRRNIKRRTLTLTLLDPELAAGAPELLLPLAVGRDGACVLPCTTAQYAQHIARLRKLEAQYENLHLRFRSDVVRNTVLYVKEDTGVVMAKVNPPMSAFVFNDPSMINAFWDYLAP